jgi:hypothetical protein
VVSKKEIASLSPTKDIPDYILIGESGECVAFGRSSYAWWEFFNEYTDFNYVQDVYPVPQGHELLYLKNGLVSYALLKSNEKSLYEYIVGVRCINPILFKYPCFLYTYGFFYNTSMSPQKMYRKRQLQASLVQHGIECQDSTPYVLIQHLHDSVPMSSIPVSERIPLLFIIYHALSRLSSSFTHRSLSMKNVMVWRPHPKKYMTYEYKGVVFQSPYVPKITDYSTAYFVNKGTSCVTLEGSIDPTLDVSLVREALPELKLPNHATVNQVYRLLKKQLVNTDHDSVGSLYIHG